MVTTKYMSKLLRRLKKPFLPYYWAYLRRKESMTHGLPTYSEILIKEKEIQLALANAERSRIENEAEVLRGQLEVFSWLKRYGNPKA